MANVVKLMQQGIDAVGKTAGFDRLLSKVKVIDGSPGRCVCQLKVEKEHLNAGGTLHGGLSTTLIDSLSTVALMSGGGPPGVSVDLHVTFMKAAKEGEVILIDCNTLRLGKTLAFLSVDIKNQEGHLLVHGRHTKHVGSR